VLLEILDKQECRVRLVSLDRLDFQERLDQLASRVIREDPAYPVMQVSPDQLDPTGVPDLLVSPV